MAAPEPGVPSSDQLPDDWLREEAYVGSANARQSRTSLLLALVLLIAGIVGATMLAEKASSRRSGDPVRASWREGQPAFTPPHGTTPIVGVNYHGVWEDISNEDQAQVLDALAATGSDWVRLDISWAMLQPRGPGSYDLDGGVARVDRAVNEIAERGLKTLLLLYWAPEWATGSAEKGGVPRDPGQFADIAAWVAERYSGRVDAIELWNEPDKSLYLADTSPVTYTALVKAAYPAIKSVAPDMTVVAGAPTYVNTDWYRSFYEHGGAGHYDALAIHPYVGMADGPPSRCDANQMMYYPCHIANLIRLMAMNGDGEKKIWATEYGWSTHDNSSYGFVVPNWKRGVSDEQQARYLLQMQEYLAQWPQVEASFWYTDRDAELNDAQEDNFGLLRRDFSRKPAYFALKCAASRVCGPALSSPASTASP